MLEHEQAAISANYKPKPKNAANLENDNNKTASRRHSSIIHSVRLNVGDVRRYSTISENAAVRKDKGSSTQFLIPEIPRAHGRADIVDEPEYHEAVSFIAAMENIHFRTLEGYFCWLHAKGKQVGIISNSLLFFLF